MKTKKVWKYPSWSCPVRARVLNDSLVTLIKVPPMTLAQQTRFEKLLKIIDKRYRRSKSDRMCEEIFEAIERVKAE